MPAGAMQLTRMPKGRYSTARERVSAMVAPLVAVYASQPGMAMTPALEEVLMIEPPPLSLIRGIPCLQHR